MAETNLIKQKLITTMGERFQMNPEEFKSALMATVLRPDKIGRQATLGEVNAFLAIAHEHGLNPFKREIYAFLGKDGGIHPMVPIDGWANIVNHCPQFNGVEFADTFDKNGQIYSIKTRIHRKDLKIPVEVIEYYHECFQDKKGSPWHRWPIRMLRHKSYIQCARLAFSLGGIYDPDEAERFRDLGTAEIVPTDLEDLAGRIPAGAAPAIPFGGQKAENPTVDGHAVPESPEDGWRPPEPQEVQEEPEGAQEATEYDDEPADHVRTWAELDDDQDAQEADEGSPEPDPGPGPDEPAENGPTPW